MERNRRICVSSKWLVFNFQLRPLLAGFERLRRVDLGV